MLALILAIIPFVTVSGVLLHFSQGLDLSSYETTLIGVNFTLAHIRREFCLSWLSVLDLSGT